ncbi:MAG TPA: o-succinylbenzoate synthase [Candidatus Korarchaeota archaeon]|nr:o-succinylbenzoate synthase [Candidatus Korarchaeota archaeon]
MRIRNIELYLVRMKLISPFETSFGVETHRETVIVRIEEEGGEVGWGESPIMEGPWYSYETSETAWHVLKDFVAPALVGFEIDGPKDMWKGIGKRVRGHNIAKAGMDKALWDLKAKLDGKSLSRMLGGVREKIDSGISIGIKRDVGELLKTIGKRLDEGYKRIKLKIKPGWDVKVLEEVRREYPDILLQVDANAAYTLDDYSSLRKLDRFDLLMIEQPLDEDDLADHSQLARKISTPICLDESIKTIHDVKAAYLLGSCEIINLKPSRVGGITKGLKIHDLCLSLGIPIWIGGMLETGIGRGFLVAMASLPGVKFPNDISASSRYYKEDIVEPEWILNPDGTLSVPKVPGIGVEVKEDMLEKVSVRRERIS